MTTGENNLDQAFKAAVREVVRAELKTALDAPAIAPADLFPLNEIIKRTRYSRSTLQRLIKDGDLVPDSGEGRLARFSIPAVKTAVAQRARAKNSARATALSILGRGRKRS